MHYRTLFIIFCSIALSACKLNLTPGPNGTIWVDQVEPHIYDCYDDECSFEINGIMENFEAVANDGYEFVRWEGLDSCNNSTEPVCTVFALEAPPALEYILALLPDVELKAIFQAIEVVEPEPEPEPLDCDKAINSPEYVLDLGLERLDEVLETCFGSIIITDPQTPSLVGSWETNCYPRSEGESGKVVLIVETDALMFIDIYQYNDTTCSYSPDVFWLTASYNFGDVVLSASGLGAWEIDFEITETFDGGPAVGSRSLDLLHDIDADSFYLGIDMVDDSRSTNIDFDIKYVRQPW